MNLYSINQTDAATALVDTSGAPEQPEVAGLGFLDAELYPGARVNLYSVNPSTRNMSNLVRRR